VNFVASTADEDLIRYTDMDDLSNPCYVSLGSQYIVLTLGERVSPRRLDASTRPREGVK